jgi:hypothetical protein
MERKGREIVGAERGSCAIRSAGDEAACELIS